MAAHALQKIALVGVCAAFVSGCGTVGHQLSSTMTYYPDGMPAYGGVQFDVERLDAVLESPRTPAKIGLAGLVVLDVPLSAAADTVLLPFWAMGNIARPVSRESSGHQTADTSEGEESEKTE